MDFYLDGQDEAGLRLVLDLMVQSKRGDFSVGNASVPISELRATGGDFSVGNASVPISELRATAERSVFKDGAGLTDLPVWASNGKDNGRVGIHYRIMSKPEVRGRQNKTGRSDGADLAHLVEKARKSLRTTTESRSASEEDRGLVVDTAAGKIDLSHLQVIDNKDLVEIKKLGSGAFGTVYAGKWNGTNVAIKRINMSRFTSQRDRLILESFKEAGILSNLHHPNIVSLYGFVLDELEGGNLAIVMELVADGSLRDILHRGNKFLDNHRKLIIAKGAASGMEYLHLKRIVHFDLKCDNLLVDLKDPSLPICKVADFGLSKFKQNSLVSGGVRGTLPWMAPELLIGDGRKVSEKVDVYSFGIVMWEILTGEVPYDGMLEGQILGGIFNNILRPPVPTSCEPKWRELMEKCWESDPQKRPSFSEIAIELHSMLVASHAKAGR